MAINIPLYPTGSASRQKGSSTKIVLIVLTVVIVAGLAVLASWDPPAPTAPVTRTLDIQDLTNAQK